MNLAENEIQELKKTFENIIHLARLTEYYRLETEKSEINNRIKSVIDSLLTNAQGELCVCSNLIYEVLDLNATGDTYEIQDVIEKYIQDSEPEEV